MYENSKERLIECHCNQELPKIDEQRLGVNKRDNNEEVATVLGRRKASLKVQQAIYNCLKDNCCVITFCFLGSVRKTFSYIYYQAGFELLLM